MAGQGYGPDPALIAISKPKFLGIILIAAVLLAVLVVTRNHKYRVGDTQLRLPREASVLGVPLWLRMIPGLDNDSRELIVLLPADYVAAHVPGYVVKDGQVSEDVTVLITSLHPEELERYRLHPLMKEMAMKTETFEGRRAEYNRAEHAWHVFGLAGHSNFYLMRIDPASTTHVDQLQSNWLGGCIEMEMTQTETGKTWSCDSYVLVDHLMGGFHYGPKNLKNYDALTAFLRQSLANWAADAR